MYMNEFLSILKTSLKNPGMIKYLSDTRFITFDLMI